jgi:hypothetical protein
LEHIEQRDEEYEKGTLSNEWINICTLRTTSYNLTESRMCQHFYNEVDIKGVKDRRRVHGGNVASPIVFRDNLKGDTEGAAF